MNQGIASSRLRPFKPLRFGRYTLLMPISTGGMGEIFLARLAGAHGFDKLCVIKKILAHLAEDTEFVDRFVDEARILVKLSHGNIAQVLDMGVHEKAPYIALEFVDGKDLRRVLSRMRDRKLPIPLSYILYVMTRVLEALAYAHRKRGDDDRELNLVHRDVSPQNVLISYEGEVKVIDFGLAKSTLSSSKTNPSIIMGKFMYMSPEQARHQKADRRSDLYAVGLCLYELITGHNPFDDVPPGELMAKVASPSIQPLIELDPLCPVALSEAVARALNPDPALRFQTAEEFRARLLNVLLDIDPEAGPETAARFMREIFAVEYHAERKMLAAMKEQASSMADEDELTELAPPTRDESSRPTVLELKAVTDVPAPAEEPAMKPASAYQPQPRPDAPKAESLSFQPTPKSAGPGEAKEDGETSPSIALRPPAEAPAAAPPKVLQRSFDEMPTEAAVPILPGPEDEPLPSIVVEGLENPADAPNAPRAGAPARRVVQKDKRRPSRPPEKRRPAAQVERTERPRAARTATVVTAALDRPTRKKSGVAVWVVLPLLAFAAVAAYIAWDVYSEQLKARQLEEEGRTQPRGDIEPRRKSREVHVEREPEEEVATLPTVDAGKPEKQAKTHRQPPAAAKASPGESAFRALKSDFELLADESVARKYRLKVTKLELEVASRSGELAFQQEVKRLDDEIKAQLARQ